MGKWKKRLRKFAKKAIPVIGLGLAATALARKRATDAPGDAHAKAKKLLTSDAAYAPAVTKNWINKKSDSDIVPQEKVVTESVPIGKMRGAGSDADAIANQIKRGNFAQSNKGITINPHDATAAAGALYNPHRVIKGRINRRAKGGSAYKSGGRVGVGKAKRGFSKILRKK